jgi:hypothetical protein
MNVTKLAHRHNLILNIINMGVSFSRGEIEKIMKVLCPASKATIARDLALLA